LQNLENAEEKMKAEHRVKVHTLQLYAVLGTAETHYSAGRYGEARRLLEPLVADMQNQARAAHWAEIKEKDPRLMRALIGVALRACVQDDQMNRGKEVIAILLQHFPQSSLEILRQVAGPINDQIQRLRQQGEPAKQQLERT